MRTQGCRKAIDYVEKHCHGLSEDAKRDVTLATRFVEDRAPYLELESTKAVNAIRNIKDPIIQGEVLKKIKLILEERVDPRSGEKLPKYGAITTPMIKWLIQWVETGEKPAYIPRSAPKEAENNFIDVLAILDELLNVRIDRRAGIYPVSEEQISKIKNLREKISCGLISNGMT